MMAAKVPEGVLRSGLNQGLPYRFLSACLTLPRAEPSFGQAAEAGAKTHWATYRSRIFAAR